MGSIPSRGNFFILLFTVNAGRILPRFSTNYRKTWVHYLYYIHPEGGSSNSDICERYLGFLTSFYNGAYGEILVLTKIKWWQVYGWVVHRNSNEQLWITYKWCELRRDIWNLCRDGKDVDRYWCPKPTSCFTFFYFRPYEAVNICPHLANPYTYFKCLSVILIINMLSIIVHYYFWVQATHKPVITRSLTAPPIQKRKKKKFS